MSLKATVKKAVSQAIAAVGDLAAEIVYHSVTPGAYDVNTDTLTTSEIVLSFKALVYKEKDESQDYKRTDLKESKVLTPSEVFDAAGVVPKNEDYLTINGIRYEIKSYKPIVGNVGFIFIVREV